MFFLICIALVIGSLGIMGSLWLDEAEWSHQHAELYVHAHVLNAWRTRQSNSGRLSQWIAHCPMRHKSQAVSRDSKRP